MPLHADAIPPAVREWLPDEFSLTEPRQGQSAQLTFVDDAQLVIKRACGPVYATWLAQEHRALVALADADLPIPRAIGLHTQPGTDGSDCEAWLVMTRLPGTPLGEVVARAENTEARADWYRRLGVIAARIHTLSVPSELVPDDPRPWLERVLERARNAPGNWVQKLAARFDRERQPDMPDTLIHGDFTIDNVLADGDAVTGVVDWGGAGPGDPRYDVTLALSRRDEQPLEPKVAAAFLEGYRSHALSRELRAFFEHSYTVP
ncbi:MAG: phosphotransferase [Nannocystaceae bacterium]|nr:phosphotransferase [Nannocystaceae bacterium]